MYRLEMTNMLSIFAQEGDQGLIGGHLKTRWQICNKAEGPAGNEGLKDSTAQIWTDKPDLFPGAASSTCRTASAKAAFSVLVLAW